MASVIARCSGMLSRIDAAITLSLAGTGGGGMFDDDLTDSQIALLCDIGEYDHAEAASEKKRDLERLISAGYVRPTTHHPGSAFELTGKGNAFLGERGAGLNEA